MTKHTEQDRIDIKSLLMEELIILVEQKLQEKKFHAGQIYQWLHKKCITSFDEMTNLSLELRGKLEKKCVLHILEPVKTQISKIDGTEKYLFRLYDNNVIESVLMRYKHGNSVCISSQAGCRMGCRFCASAIDGLARNLSASEMLEQIYRIQVLTGERISNVVVMGSGEPFDNFEHLIKFITLLNSEEGLNISARNITVSTCGIVPGIKELADIQTQITLAISLHAPDNEIRKSFMPIAKKYPIEEIIEACRYYIKKTGRRITFEYSMIKGINDNERCAKQLISLIKGMNCHVNLIPVNPIKERDFRQTDQKQIHIFKNVLEKVGINVTIRREMGRDINGACGQLRKSYSDHNTREEQI